MFLQELHNEQLTEQFSELLSTVHANDRTALAQVKQPKVNILVDYSELDGWELRAAWDDFKLGLKHNNEFNNIAILGRQINAYTCDFLRIFVGIGGKVRYQYL